MLSNSVRRHREAEIFKAVIVSLGLAAPCGAVAEDQPISTAETALFVTDHLKGISGQQILHYSFDKKGSLEAPAHDDISVVVGPSPTGNGHKVDTKCSMGGQTIPVESIDSALGNPVIQCFLERDLLEMNRLTTTTKAKGGSTYFFRRRIRLALAESADIKEIEVTFDGKKIPAREIRITPYAKDPERVRDNFKRFADKIYVFQVSDVVPGGVVKLGTVIPDIEKQDAPALIEESVVLSRSEPKGNGK
ncbi:MAG: hypothetical protein E6R14_05200 [Thermomicrobiales bacterium]|jgi:hypothetical protein|nr:MAG: hypothetical protein E6R14_05200 [Thermomicrobiales bacterium]